MVKIGIAQHRQAAVRRKAVDRVLNGITVQEVADSLKVTRQAVHRWINQFDPKNSDSLNARPHSGRPKKLNDCKYNQLLVLLATKTPGSYDSKNGFWTNQAVKKLISTHFNTNYSLASTKRLLAIFKFRKKHGSNSEKFSKLKAITSKYDGRICYSFFIQKQSWNRGFIVLENCSGGLRILECKRYSKSNLETIIKAVLAENSRPIVPIRLGKSWCYSKLLIYQKEMKGQKLLKKSTA
jgi:transposase